MVLMMIIVINVDMKNLNRGDNDASNASEPIGQTHYCSRPGQIWKFLYWNFYKSSLTVFAFDLLAVFDLGRNFVKLSFW